VRPKDGGQAGTAGASVDAAPDVSDAAGGTGGPDVAPDQADDGDAATDAADQEVDPDPMACTATKHCDPIVEVCIEIGAPPLPGVDSCGTRWECYTHAPPDDGDTLEHPCPPEQSDFCGCDGVTFQRGWYCADRPYDHIGACDDGFGCDPRRVLCADPEPSCPDGQLAAVVKNCWGPCIPISMCRCEFHWQCRPSDKVRCSTYPDFRCVPFSPDGGTDGPVDGG